MLLYPSRYWHCCTLGQYQYGHSPLPILALNCASIGIGISAFWFSTSMGTVHYQYRHSIMVPVLVFTFLHFGSVPVLTHTITRTGIQKLCLPSIGIVAHWFSTSMGIVHYWYLHYILTIPVLAFLHLGSVTVQAQSITHIGIQKWCPYWYWHFCTLVQYQYGHIPLPELGFNNGSSTGIGIFVLGYIISIGRGHYWYWHSMVPDLVLAFWHFGSVPVWAHYITGTGA